MKRMLISIPLLIALLLCSCGSKGYLDTLVPHDMTDAITSEILGDGLYAEYTDKELGLIFGSHELYDSSSVIYSLSSDDIGEVGIFHAFDSKSADSLFEKASKYIEDTKKEKSEFVRNYMPAELDKLNYAEARRFGNYVVYTLLSSDDARAVYDSIEKMLKE